MMNLDTTLCAAALLAWIAQGLNPGLTSGSTPEVRSNSRVPESQESRNDLPCTVTPIKPYLGFDFTFHSGYDVVIPRKELAGLGNELNVFIDVVAQDGNDVPIHLSQKLSVVSTEDFRGNGAGHGAFLLGEGNYHVDWAMRDQHSRVCRASWDAKAKVPPKNAAMRTWIQPQAVQAPNTLFVGETWLPRESQAEPLKVDIIVNFAPRDVDSAIIDPDDLEDLVAILRRIVRDPHIGECSLVACSLSTQQILYRQEDAYGVDFPAIGEALKSLRLGLIDAKNLTARNGPAQFVAQLVGEQAKKRGRDALIIVGPKPNAVPAISHREILDTVTDFDRPVFYLNYDSHPAVYPWRDLIGSVVKQKHGVEYTITHPKDLFDAWSEIISRIVRIRHSYSN
jgi:hypothetical protein